MPMQKYDPQVALIYTVYTVLQYMVYTVLRNMDNHSTMHLSLDKCAKAPTWAVQSVTTGSKRNGVL